MSDRILPLLAAASAVFVLHQLDKGLEKYGDNYPNWLKKLQVAAVLTGAGMSSLEAVVAALELVI